MDRLLALNTEFLKQPDPPAGQSHLLPERTATPAAGNVK